MGLTTDWLIGNGNTLLLDNFRDSYLGTIENSVDAYMSLCESTRHDITDATNATPIVITSAAHGLVDGDIVTVVNVGGNGAAKGTFVVNQLTTSTFELVGSAGDGAYTGGGEFYKCVDDASDLSLTNVADGTYLVDVAGTLPLEPLDQYVLIVYCLGAFRDLYNEIIRVVARNRGSA